MNIIIASLRGPEAATTSEAPAERIMTEERFLGASQKPPHRMMTGRGRIPAHVHLPTGAS